MVKTVAIISARGGSRVFFLIAVSEASRDFSRVRLHTEIFSYESGRFKLAASRNIRKSITVPVTDRKPGQCGIVLNILFLISQ